MNSRIADEGDSIELLRKIPGQFSAGAFMNHHGDIDAATEEQFEIVISERCLSAEGEGSVLGHKQNAQRVGPAAVRYAVVRH
jgi:hypothetical protein